MNTLESYSFFFYLFICCFNKSEIIFENKYLPSKFKKTSRFFVHCLSCCPNNNNTLNERYTTRTLLLAIFKDFLWIIKNSFCLHSPTSRKFVFKYRTFVLFFSVDLFWRNRKIFHGFYWIWKLWRQLKNQNNNKTITTPFKTWIYCFIQEIKSSNPTLFWI